MTVKYFNFVDGQRLPGARVKEFLMNQAVIQCANQTEITGSGIETYGARVALNLEDGQIWTYAGEPAAWAPAQNALDLDLLDARYLTRIAADGIYLTETQANGKYLTDAQAAQKYLTILTAQGLYITEGQADGKYLTPSQANALYLTPLDADSRYITLVSAGQIYLRKDDADTSYQRKPGSGTFITDIQAGQIYLSQTTASQTYLTQIGAGTLYLQKGNAASDINNNSTTIDGGKITTNTINVNRLQAGTLTGFRVQTSSSGQRVVMSEATNSLVFFNSSGTEIGRIQGLSNFNYDTPTNHAFAVNGSTVLSVNGNGMSLAPGNSVNSNLPVSGTITATGAIYSTGSYLRSGSGSYATLGSDGSINRDAASGSNTRYANWTSGGNLVPGAAVSSDERLKENIEITNLGLDFVNDLRPVKFNFKNPDSPLDDGEQFGVIAQEIEATLLEHGVDANNGIVYRPIYEGVQEEYYSVNHLQLIAPLIKSIQELSAKNDALEARLAALEGAN